MHPPEETQAILGLFEGEITIPQKRNAQRHSYIPQDQTDEQPKIRQRRNAPHRTITIEAVHRAHVYYFVLAAESAHHWD
jgi:hypothetical protein